jgi:hypothetical protein
MSIRSVVEFWRSVQTNPELQAKLDELQSTDDPFVGGAEVARAAGFEVTPQEMREVDAVVSFWERVEGDDALREKLAPAHEAETPEEAMREIARIAGEAGHPLPLEALQHVTGALVNSGGANRTDALSDEQLDAVAGGAVGGSSYSSSLQRARRQQWKEIIRRGPGAVGAKP